MDTTTPDDGAQAQPETTAAVTTGYNADQVITMDSNGTPTVEPVTGEETPTSQSDDATEEATPPEATQEEVQAPSADDTVEWAKKKGLDINPDNPTEVKLANMQREAERKMHQATQTKVAIQPPELLQETGDPNYDPLVERQNNLELKQYVRDWFDANPELKEHRDELQRISVERPYLQDMDDLKAHFYANPSREAQLKLDGGRDALKNLAQKQQQIPPGTNATNSGVYASQAISPKNVYDLVDRNDQVWFEKNHEAISKAMSGK